MSGNAGGLVNSVERLVIGGLRRGRRRRQAPPGQRLVCPVMTTIGSCRPRRQLPGRLAVHAGHVEIGRAVELRRERVDESPMRVSHPVRCK
jgi:hypothetical protein